MLKMAAFYAISKKKHGVKPIEIGWFLAIFEETSWGYSYSK